MPNSKSFAQKDVDVTLTTASKNSLIYPAREYIGKRVVISEDAVTGTVYVVSTNDPSVDLTAAASNTNPYQYIGLIDLDATTPVAGSTGIVASANSSRAYKINDDYMDYIAFKSDISAGTATISLALTNNA